MKLGAAFWLERTDWDSLREAIVSADAAGFDSLWFDDHLLSDEGDPDDPKLEGWTVASAAAAITERATIGHLVTANTFRSPGLLAKMATTLDHISGGRAVLGVGAGWFEREHEAFGLDFGASPGERIERMGEAVSLVRRLLDGERVSHDGGFYRLIVPSARRDRSGRACRCSLADPDPGERFRWSPGSPTRGTPMGRPKRSPPARPSWTSGAGRSGVRGLRSSARPR